MPELFLLVSLSWGFGGMFGMFGFGEMFGFGSPSLFFRVISSLAILTAFD